MTLGELCLIIAKRYGTEKAMFPPNTKEITIRLAPDGHVEGTEFLVHETRGVAA